MSKGKKGSKENPVSLNDLVNAVENGGRAFEITEATIKDDFCHYKYEVTRGVGLGDTHTVNGTGIIKDELREAFIKFNVHLAVIDEVFKHSGIEITDIDTLNDHELTGLFHVTAFKMKGSSDLESIQLIGNKYVSSAGGRIELKSPWITLDNLGSYKWYNELKDAATVARNEVARYKEGNYIAVEEDDLEDPKQGKLELSVESNSNADFDNAKV